MKPTAFALTMLLLCHAASAGTVYRCGPQGNVYSDVPCADGRTVDAADPRSAEQRAQAIRVAALDRRFAAEMERERLMLAAVKPAAAGKLGPEPAPAVAPLRSAKRQTLRKPSATLDFVAVAPLKTR